LSCHFMILQEINKQRERAMNHLEATPETTSQIDNQRVLYLDVNFLKYWSLLTKRGRTNVMAQEIQSLTRYDVILMLYFPKMQASTPTPTPDDESQYSTPNGEDAEEAARIKREYTPFLMELYPRTNKIKLYYKPLIDEQDETVAENFDNKLVKISELCVDLLQRIAQTQDKTIDLQQIQEDAESVEIPVNNWQEFVIAASNIAEAHAFKRQPKIDDFSLERSRNKLIDMFVQLLKFD